MIVSDDATSGYNGETCKNIRVYVETLQNDLQHAGHQEKPSIIREIKIIKEQYPGCFR